MKPFLIIPIFEQAVVASPTGAWIETGVQLHTFQERKQLRPLRARGLKHDNKLEYLGLIAPLRPLRARGLKQLALSAEFAGGFGRAPRGVTVRLLGLNTPETVDPRKPVECFGQEASQYAKRLLADQTVYVDIALNP